MTTDAFQRRFLLILVAVISLLFFWMIRSFIVTLLFAALFSSMTRPLYLRILGWVKGRQAAASGLTILALVVLLIIPLFSFFGIIANQAVKVTQDVAPWVQENLGDREELNRNILQLPGYHYIAPYSRQIVGRIGTMISGLGNFIFRHLSAFTAGTFMFFVNLAIMLYAMFFFFIDGPAVLEKFLYYLPLKEKDEKKILKGFQSMARATIKGLAVIGLVQGSLAGLALWAAGIQSALFWGTVMALFSMIPNIGSALIWIPACIYLFMKGQTAAAILVFLWCAVVVGSADNILRPILVGKDTKVHELMVLVSTLGGLTMFGLEGFILGPVIALVFLTVWDIYGQTFKDVLPKPTGL